MKVGFIGTGIMGSAIIEGLINNKVVAPSDIIGADVYAPGRERVQEKYGINVTDNNKEAVENSDLIIMSTKPYFYADILDEIRDSITEDKIIVAMAAGITLDFMDEHIGKPAKVIRIIPNVNARVGASMTGACVNAYVTDDDKTKATEIFSSFGHVEYVPENLMEAVTAAASATPAFIFMMIEAMADAAVEGGVPRAQAYPMVAQAVLGSAKLVMETGNHPGALKDMVCSPGGVTIKGVHMLESKGMRTAFMDAIKACTDAQLVNR